MAHLTLLYRLSYFTPMNTHSIIKALGGRKAVINMTGLHRASISHWVLNNVFPPPWLKFFQVKFPRLNWAMLIAEPPPPEHIPTKRPKPAQKPT